MMKFYWLFIVSVPFLSAAGAAQDCQILSDAKKSALVEYIRKEYKLKEDTSLKLSKDELIHDTCYREIT